MAIYDKYYKKQSYFGNPYTYLMDYFRNSRSRGKLCDLGAGQGRDSIPLYEMGYDVVSVDVSKVGLAQINEVCPDIKTVQMDIDLFDIYTFDFILMDSMVHFYKNDIEIETKRIERVLNEMKPGGIFVNCMIKSKKAEKILKNIILKYGDKIIVKDETYVLYPEYKSEFHFMAIECCR